MFPPDVRMTELSVPDLPENEMEEFNIESFPQTNEAQSVANRTYAVILSGGGDMFMNDERYWNDCSFIYQTLVRRYGVPKSNIFPLISDGDDPLVDMALNKGGYKSSPTDLDGDGVADYEYAATQANLDAVFGELGQKMQADDHLFLFVIDHGGMSGDGLPFILLWNRERLSGIGLKAMIKPLLDKHVTINAVFGQCNSGAFVDVLRGSGCVVATACAADEPSYASANNQFDEFVYHWTCAVNGAVPNGYAVKADANRDGVVSMSEAFNYARLHDKYTMVGSKWVETPQYMSEPTAIGQTLAFDRLCESDLYIKDNHNDSGIEPNTTTSNFWDSPSIWVRNAPDGIEEHENPIFSWDHQQAFVYFRVHNRGIKPYYGNGLWGHVYWAKASTAVSDKTWKGRELYNGQWLTGDHLESCGLNKTIEPGESAVFMARWSLPNLMETDADNDFHYCLAIKLLDTSYDDGYQEGKTYFQIANNRRQAQKNLTIVRAQDAPKGVKVFVRNVLAQNAKYSLELVPRNESDLDFFKIHRGKVEVEMSPVVYGAWQRGGMVSSDVEIVPATTVGETSRRVRFLSANSKLDAVSLNKSEFDSVRVRFCFNKPQLVLKKYYTYDLIQKDELGNIVGGETFKVEIPQPTLAVSLEKTETEDGQIMIEVIDDDCQSFSWTTANGEVISSDKAIIVVPQKTAMTYDVLAMKNSGELAAGSIRIAPDYHIEELTTDAGGSHRLVVKLSKKSPANSLVVVTSVIDSSKERQVVVPQDCELVDIEWSSLPAGVYVVTYIVDGEIADRRKITKRK